MLYLLGDQLIFNFLTPFLITVVPTLLMITLVYKSRLVKSGIFLIVCSWFLGQYFFTWLIFIAVNLISIVTDQVLLKSLILSFFVLLGILYVRRQDVTETLNDLYKLLKRRDKYQLFMQFMLCGFIFLFSYSFYANHLMQAGSKIYTSSAYWDFQWHMPLIQNFIFGDNFPPENESFAGFPATYHFFWGLWTAIYAVSGMGLIQAVNFVSIFTLYIFLIGVIGFMDEVLGSKKAGFIAVLLIISSSSLRFFYELSLLKTNSFMFILRDLVITDKHPYFHSFLPGNPYGYNGTMFNLFYFLAERQMVPGLIFLLLITFIFYKKEKLSSRFMFIAGILAGFYFLWHLYITIMVFTAAVFLLLFAPRKKKILYFVAGYSVIFYIHYFYFKLLQGSNWFVKDVATFPRLNFNFPTMNGTHGLSIINFISYYVFGYGLKLLLLLKGLILLRKHNNKLFYIILSFILPTFILLNSIQLSPLSIYDNHKWLRPMNIFVDIAAGFGFYFIFIKKGILKLLFIPGLLVLLFLSLSGLIELVPFLKAKPDLYFADEKTELVQFIRNHTASKSIFIGDDSREIQLAGRKLFLGNYSGQDLRLDSNRRLEIINEIYGTTAIDKICKQTYLYGIDYLEYKESKNIPANTIFVTSHNTNNAPVYLVDLKLNCTGK